MRKLSAPTPKMGWAANCPSASLQICHRGLPDAALGIELIRSLAALTGNSRDVVAGARNAKATIATAPTSATRRKDRQASISRSAANAARMAPRESVSASPTAASTAAAAAAGRSTRGPRMASAIELGSAIASSRPSALGDRNSAVARLGAELPVAATGVAPCVAVIAVTPLTAPVSASAMSRFRTV